MGPQRLARAPGVASASRAQHRRLIAPSVASYRCARAILLCCHTSHTGGVPAVPPSHARAAEAFMREARKTSINAATAAGAGFGGGARLPSSSSSPYGPELRAVPVRALYLAVPSYTGGLAVPPAHTRAAVVFTRGARVTSIAGAAAHGAGMGANARLASSPPWHCST